MVDEAVPVLVDHVEGLLELLDLVLVEHGEHVGGGALGALLRAAHAACGLAARHLREEEGNVSGCQFANQGSNLQIRGHDSWGEKEFI